MQRLSVEEFLKLAETINILDVRTPTEYIHGHIPGAINLPLFSNIERAVIGTSYKHEGKQNAILKGLDIVGPKMKWLAEKALKNSVDNKLLLYCWRGGMRSASVAWLLEFTGLQVYVLEGGYKNYRQMICKTFNIPKKFIILSGKTGSGKTKILHNLQDFGQQIIDLEGIANHKGSAFGSLGQKKQPTQEQFENNLGTILNKYSNNNLIWIEDESRTIGRCAIPSEIWQGMRSSKVCIVEIPIQTRIKYLIDEYGNFKKQDLIKSVDKIAERLGGLRTQQVKESMELGEIKKAIEIILEYYDKAYNHGLSKREANTINHFDASEYDLEFKKIAEALIRETSAI